MVSNLLPRPVPGVGAESKFIESHLLDANGRVRDLDQVSREIGDATAQFTYLDYELREHLRTPMTRGYPPKIFISYRRETPEHVRWCVNLARKLKANGYAVALDALTIAEANPPADVLAEFVGQLATADVALIVLTESYAGTADGVRRWMFEEWLRIDALHSFGLLELAWVIRDPDWYASYEGSLKPTSIFHGVIELSRQDLSDHRPVLEFFGRYTGPRLSRRHRELLARGAHACVKACRARDEQAAGRHLASIAKFADTEEFQVANVSYHAAFRLPGQAYALAEQARAKNLTLPATVEMATSLWVADLDDYAFRAFAEAADSSPWSHGFIHFVLGDILARRNFPRSALNHLNWCSRTDLKHSWERWGDLPAGAQDKARDLAAVLERIVAASAAVALGPPSAEWALPEADHRCEVCLAGYSSAGSACVLCGTLHPAGRARCAMCGYPVLPVKDLPFCPVCRFAFAAAGGDRARCSVIPQGPGKRFSVLWPQASPGPGSYAPLPSR